MQKPPSNTQVTVFGGTGFVGRQVVRQLAQAGYRIRVATRKPNENLSVRPLGDVGQIALVKADIRNAAQVREAIVGSSCVVNLVGILRPGGGQSFEALHVQGAATIAAACAATGVSRLVQFSSIGADPNSSSRYAKSRAGGEAAARHAFPGTTVLRPSIIFGAGDGFFNLFGSLMRWSRFAFPAFGGGKTRFQPIFVGDVAAAVAGALSNDRTRGKTYELGGPAVYTLRQILEMIANYTDRQRALFTVPFFALDIVAALFGWLPFFPLTFDQVRLLKKDNVVKVGPDATAVGTLSDLGVSATTVEAIVPAYLVAYRAAGQFTEKHSN